MTTIVELCNTHNLNPKVVRAKLRRAIKAGDLKVSHEHRGQWVVNPAILSFLGLKIEQPKKVAKKAPAKKASAKKTPAKKAPKPEATPTA